MNYPTSIHGNPVTVPATNLNIGMDVWNASSAGPGVIQMQPNASGPVIGHEGRINDQWMQVHFLFFSSFHSLKSVLLCLTRLFCLAKKINLSRKITTWRKL